MGHYYRKRLKIIEVANQETHNMKFGVEIEMIGQKLIKKTTDSKMSNSQIN